MSSSLPDTTCLSDIDDDLLPVIFLALPIVDMPAVACVCETWCKQLRCDNVGWLCAQDAQLARLRGHASEVLRSTPPDDLCETVDPAAMNEMMMRAQSFYLMRHGDFGPGALVKRLVHLLYEVESKALRYKIQLEDLADLLEQAGDPLQNLVAAELLPLYKRLLLPAIRAALAPLAASKQPCLVGEGVAAAASSAALDHQQTDIYFPFDDDEEPEEDRLKTREATPSMELVARVSGRLATVFKRFAPLLVLQRELLVSVNRQITQSAWLAASQPPDPTSQPPEGSGPDLAAALLAAAVVPRWHLLLTDLARLQTVDEGFASSRRGARTLAKAAEAESAVGAVTRLLNAEVRRSECQTTASPLSSQLLGQELSWAEWIRGWVTWSE